VVGNGLFSANLTVNGTLNGNGSGLTALNASNIATGTLSNSRLGIVGTTNGGTGLSTAPTAAGQYLRSTGAGTWGVGTIVAADLPALPFVAKAGDTMTGTLNLPANGLVAGTSQLVLSGGNVGIGTTTTGATLDIQKEISGDTLMLTSFGSVGALIGRIAGGTRAAPTATASSDSLLFLGGRGHTGSAFTSSSKASIDFQASQGWTSTANGTRIRFSTTTTGTSTATERMRIENDGDVGIGTTSPENRLHVSATIMGTNNLANHIAQVENNSTDQQASVLALKLGQSTPGASNSYITFFKGANQAGTIRGDGTGGIVTVSFGADYAEFLPRLNPAERIQPGDIVGQYGGRITKQTRGASQVMAVSTSPIVLGNDPGEEARRNYEQVAFIGQVKVRVRGKVQAGDFIVASGLNDGVAVAVSPECISSEQFSQAVGQAWEASSDGGVKLVRTAVGLVQRDPTVSRLLEHNRQQTAKIAALDARLTAIESKLKDTGERNLSVTRKASSPAKHSVSRNKALQR
jgi:hypothetical protein